MAPSNCAAAVLSVHVYGIIYTHGAGYVLSTVFFPSDSCGTTTAVLVDVSRSLVKRVEILWEERLGNRARTSSDGQQRFCGPRHTLRLLRSKY